MGARVLLLALAVGCAHGTVEAPAPAEKAPLAVAVIGFGGSNQAASAAEDGCVMAVLEAGLRAVARQRVVMALPNENDVDFGRVGRVLGVDLIIDGGVARGSDAVEPLRLEPRMISAHSASELGMARSRGRVRLTREVGHRACAELLRQLP